MTPKEFVDAVRIVVRDGGARAVLRQLEKPPGRMPSASLLRLSEWLHKRSPDEREMMERIVELTARHTAYALLAVLDGIMSIEPEGPKGKLELFWQKGSTRVLLNDPKELELTSLFKEETTQHENN